VSSLQRENQESPPARAASLLLAGSESLALRANRVLHLNGGVYRASHNALYRSFGLARTPIRALTNE
jgi:hypothetical protein